MFKTVYPSTIAYLLKELRTGQPKDLSSFSCSARTFLCEVSGSHGGVGRGSTLVACYTVPNGKQSLTQKIKALRNVRRYLTLLLGTETQPQRRIFKCIISSACRLALGLVQSRTQRVPAGLSLEAKPRRYENDG